MMSPDKFEKLLWDTISVLFSIIGAAVSVWFSYLVLLYSFS